jgi:hypothetical protein
MPILDAGFLDTDPEGAELLRSVLDTGRRARRRTIADLLKAHAPRPAETRPAEALRIEIAATDEPIHPGVLAIAAG